MPMNGSDTLDPRINRALAQFNRRGLHGKNWSVEHAAQSLDRVGHNTDQDQARATVWDLPVTHETLLKPSDGNLIDTVSSSSAADAGKTVNVYGSYFDAGGNLVRLLQQVVLNGQTKVTLATPIARCCELVMEQNGALAGDVYLYQDTAITAGVPTDLTKVANYINGSNGEAQSLKAGCVTAGDEVLFVTQTLYSINRRASAICDFVLEFKHVTSDMWLRGYGRVTLNSQAQNALVIDKDVPLPVPPNHDVRITADSSANNAETTAAFFGHYAKRKAQG